MSNVAEASANVPVKKITAAWKKLSRADDHAIKAMRSKITQLKLDWDDTSISDVSK